MLQALPQLFSVFLILSKSSCSDGPTPTCFFYTDLMIDLMVTPDHRSQVFFTVQEA